MTKAPELLRAVDYLRARFGNELEVLDHWDADLMATGLVRRGVVGKLAYLSVHQTSTGPRFFIAFENPPEPGVDVPYADAGQHEDLDLREAADLIGAHLGWA